MKTKLLTVSVCILAVVCLVLTATLLFLSPGNTDREIWFEETDPQSGYTVIGETESEQHPLGFLAVLGPRRVNISVRDTAGNNRALFSTNVADDGGRGAYSILWTEDGFELTVSGSEQAPLTYCFRWEDIFH